LKAEVSSTAQLRLNRVRTHVSQHPGDANLGTHFDITVSQPRWAIVESAVALPTSMASDHFWFRQLRKPRLTQLHKPGDD
jgi:hypothetical protein